MSRAIDPVSHGQVAYFRPYHSRKIQRCKIDTSSFNASWTTLKECPVRDTSLAVLAVDGTYDLYAVGGETETEGKACTNVIYRFKNGEWIEAGFSPMNVARKQTTVVLYQNYLIVAGGRGAKGPTDVVEILDPKAKKWKRVASLPRKMFRASGCICKGYLYLIGFHDIHETGKRPSKMGYRASLDDLINNRSDVFKPIAEIRLLSCAFVSVSDRIFAIGGSEMRDGELMSSNLIYEYDPEDDVWKKRKEALSTARSYPFAIAFDAMPRPKVMVVGGNTPRQDSSSTDQVEYIELP